MSGNKYRETKSDKGKLTKNDRNGLRMKELNWPNRSCDCPRLRLKLDLINPEQTSVVGLSPIGLIIRQLSAINS